MSNGPTEPATWRTKDGRTILVTKLDDGHLKSIFEMIRGKAMFNFEIFMEMVSRGLWDADPGVLTRTEFKAVLDGAPATRNGSMRI